MELPSIIEADQVAGWIVVESMPGYNSLSRAVGTRTGRLFKSEGAAEKLAASLGRDMGNDYIVLAVQRYDC